MDYPAGQSELYYLILQAIEGRISESDFMRLEEYLRESSECCDIYSDLSIMYSYLRRPALTFNSQSVEEPQYSVLDPDIWLELAEYEKSAPELRISREEPQRELIQKVVYPPRPKRQLSKFSIITFINVAAVILFFVIFRFVPSGGGAGVATLVDSINAKWADVAVPMDKGTRMITGSEKLLLREGYVELLFDTNASVVIEAPAEFQILAFDRIGLNYGKVYSMVPKEAVGFSVYTQNAKIIDMGTEFGVKVDPRGDTRLHVVKGKTMLIAGDSSDQVSIEVGKGQAKEISAVTSNITDISCDSDLFVRTIDSEVGVVWKGQTVIDLADIVGGGNGFGTGRPDTGISPLSGKPASILIETQESTNQYRPVPSNPYVDGVFVPNGETQQVISTQGHLFLECPASSGTCFSNICYAKRDLDSQPAQDGTPSVSSPVNCVLIHANEGITYDLRAIRKLLPGASIVRFQSTIGIENNAVRPLASNADFWVLVDGKLRYKKEQVTINEIDFIDLELSKDDRFLTLIATDGRDQKGRIVDNMVSAPIDSDWCVFSEPVLVIE